MSAEAQERWLQITAGKGPAECAWAVTQVIERLCREAAEHGVAARVVTLNAGPEPGTAESALLAVSGAKAEFINSWKGTVQWIAKSPFRPLHKRKNWFVGIDVWTPVEKVRFDAKDVKWETMRASGPGGQHVNRTESAVRITHLPTGIQATASEERSQHRNRKLALARLAQRIAELNKGKHKALESKDWEAHQTLERGSPVRVFREGEK